VDGEDFLIRESQINNPNKKNQQGENYPDEAVGFSDPLKG
jgi:hypothetical protein